MLRSSLLWVSENEWCRESLPRYRFVRRAAKRFMPGESLDAALVEARRLESNQGIPTLVTYLGENVTDRREAEAVVEHYLAALDAIESAGLDCELSVKPTHLGLDVGEAVAEEGIRRLAEAAGKFGRSVWLDMEYSRYVKPTLDIFRSIQPDNNNLGVCLQAYLHRTEADLESLIDLGPKIRLVKGAYAEAPDVAMASKGDVDASFYRLALRMLAPDARSAGLRAGLATHDVGLLGRIRDWSQGEGLEQGAYEVQMLYGIAESEQRRLARSGAPIRVLISYGSHWFPWYVRRLAERPANVWFVMRSMIPS